MKGAGDTVKSEVKKSAGKAAKKAPKAKQALKRMVSEIDAQAACKALICVKLRHCNATSYESACSSIHMPQKQAGELVAQESHDTHHNTSKCESRRVPAES